MRTRHALIALLLGCGRLDAVDAETGAEIAPDAHAPSIDPGAHAPPIRRGNGAMGLSVWGGDSGKIWARFHAERGPDPIRAGACSLEDIDDIPTDRRPETSAGRIAVTTTSAGVPLSMELLWDAKQGTYFDGGMPKLALGALGPIRFRAEGGDVPPFDVTIAPLRPMAITTPSKGTVIRGRDLPVQWETDDPAGGVVELWTGRGHVVCSFRPGVRAVTIPGDLLQAALAARRDAELPASCAAGAGSCGVMMVVLVRGTTIPVGDYDVSVNMNVVESLDLGIGAD